MYLVFHTLTKAISDSVNLRLRLLLIVAVLELLPGPALVGAVLEQAVTDPLPDVDEVLVGRHHHVVHQLRPLQEVPVHSLQVYFT